MSGSWDFPEIISYFIDPNNVICLMFSISHNRFR